MSLDAVVYVNKKNFKNTLVPIEALEVDDYTGEIYSFINEFDTCMRDQDVIALSCKLGNMDMINYLYQTLANFSNPENSIILNKILYSGSHSGDILALSDVQDLKAEIFNLRGSYYLKDAAVSEFLETLTNLIQVSEFEQNPIVFV